jgi:hypothetical protein
MNPAYFHKLIVLLLFTASSFAGFSQDTLKHKRVKVLPTPAFAFAPETNLSMGAVCLFTLDLYNDSLTRSSNAKVKFSYTLRKQLISEAQWNYFFKEEKWFTGGSVLYSKYPDLYFGIGSNTSTEGETSFESHRIIVEVNGLKKIYKKWFAGISFRHLNYFDFAIDENGTPYSELKSDSRTGLGWVVLNDKRNNLLTASEGSYLSLSNNHNFGSSYYSQIVLDGRKYFSWGKKVKQTVAGRVYSKHIIGSAPFFDIALLGSDKLVRGYFYGRFRDVNLTTFQAEYRALLFWRIGVAAFGGASFVYKDFNDFNSSTLKPNVGAGLRLLVDKKERTSLRLDYAIGMNGEWGFYASFGESF